MTLMNFDDEVDIRRQQKPERLTTEAERGTSGYIQADKPIIEVDLLTQPSFDKVIIKGPEPEPEPVEEVPVESDLVPEPESESEPELQVIDVTDRATLFCGDSRSVLQRLPANSIDAIVTDPPYGLSKEPDAVEVLTNWLEGNDYVHTGGGFMGKSWDSFVPGPALWKEALRVLKPGGHILCFAGSRTVDLMGMSLRLAGFQIRDQLQWLYGSGFPKGLDIAKAIDKKAGHWRGRAGAVSGGSVAMAGPHYERTDKGEPITDEAKQWDGWDVNLKPGHEPIILARKPLEGTVADTVLEWGTGGINIGATRVEGDRWPANILLTHHEACEADRCHVDCAVGLLDNQAPEGKPKKARTGKKGGRDITSYWNEEDGEPSQEVGFWPVDPGGGVSRFFYVSKASKKEREAGLEGEASGESKTKTKRVNVHPTVKPVELMRYLVRLVTPDEGLVLDPFNGSGSTGIAAVLEGKRYVGIELDPDYVELSRKRILHWSEME